MSGRVSAGAPFPFIGPAVAADASAGRRVPGRTTGSGVVAAEATPRASASPDGTPASVATGYWL